MRSRRPASCRRPGHWHWNSPAHRIRVNALAPGYIDTDINHAVVGHARGREADQAHPQRRVGHESDLDGAILLLASQASRYMTGSTVTVDGGFLLN
jgi:3-oxoacyl-[acyl-carrier protein] reductase